MSLMTLIDGDLIDMEENHLLLSRMKDGTTSENCQPGSNAKIMDWVGETPHSHLFVYDPVRFQAWQVEKVLVDNEHDPPCVLVFLQDDV